MAGTVVISLDFELGWGHRQVRPEYVEKLRQRESKIADRIDSLIQCFENHNIGATWAVVGKLLEDGDDPLYYNPRLVKKVRDSQAGHEVGLHSYSHRPFSELNRCQAREEIDEGLSVLSRFKIRPSTFIYPQNEIKHTDLLVETEFQCYRDNKRNQLRSRIPIIDSIPTIIPPLAQPERTNSGLVSFPGSLFLANPNRPIQVLRYQAYFGLQRAILEDSVVHFWAHPHNFVICPAALDLLDNVFTKIEDHRNNGKLKVETMEKVASKSQSDNDEQQ